MKRENVLLAIICVLFFVFSIKINAQINTNEKKQNWLSVMQDPNATFFDIQKAANDYFSKKDITQKGIGYKVFKRWEYINEARILKDGKFRSPDYVFRQYEKYLRDHSDMRSASGNWTMVAPTSYPVNNTGQPTGMGRINAIAFHPTDPNTIFIGAASGGIWKTTNPNGNNTAWVNLANNLPTLGVSAILVHPTDPNIIYIGSGDRDGGNATGMGVFKTTDGGTTWIQINNTMGDRTVGAMLMHPSDPNTIIAATSNGIYKTTNGGTTWSLKTSGNFKDIKFKPGDPNIVYAVRTLTPAHFYRSTDAGDTWTDIVSGGIPTTDIGSRMVIGVSPDDPNYVYLVQIWHADETFAGLLRSTDSGLNFVTQSTTPNIFDYACNGSGTSSQATYDLCISVDPLDANTVYVGSINNWKSTNGGVNWTIVSHWAENCSGIGLNVSEVHADQHVYEWNNGILYVGHDGGISFTSNNGTSWTEITGNLAITQIYRLGQSATQSNLVIYGQQDNGCNASVGANLTTIRGGDGLECVVDYSNTNYCFDTYTYGDISRSINGPTGNYTNVCSTGTNGIPADESGDWITPYFLHKTDPTKMFAGYENVFRCDNIRATPSSTVTFNAISTGETTTCRVLEQSPANVDIIYVVRPVSLQRTDNANASPASVAWTECTLPGGTTPVDIKAHPTDANIVYAVSHYNIYKSTDKGDSWSDITGNLPLLFINCLVLDKNANEGIYIGNETSIWYKDATMANWILFSSGLPPVDIRELEIYYDAGNPANNRIKAATYGRGLWQSDLAEINVINPTNFTANAVSPSQINLAWTKNAANDNVMIAWSLTYTFGVPADGTAYSSGNTLPSGGGTVCYVGSLSSFSHTSLMAGTTYYYKIWSVNGSNQYSAGLPYIFAKTFSHNWTGGAGTTDWFTPGNWGPNSVPTSADGVYIPQSASFQPQINAAGAVCMDILIETGASLTMSVSTAYTLSVSGDWTNNGTFNRGIGTVDFNGTNALQTIKGSSTTAFNILKVSKESATKILESNSPISTSSYVVINSGTFKLNNSASTVTIGSSTSDRTISSNKRLWVNLGTVNSTGTLYSWGGEIKVSGGILNLGSSNITYHYDGNLIIDGGQLVVTRIDPYNSDGSSEINYFQSGGIVTVGSSSSSNTSKALFDLTQISSFTMSAGSIEVKRASSFSSDYQNLCSSYNVTGGILQIGNGSTPSGQTIRINSSVPVWNFKLNAINSPKATLVTNNLTVMGSAILEGGEMIIPNTPPVPLQMIVKGQ